MNIIYKKNFPVTAIQVADVFKRSGIKRPIDDLDRIQKMVENGNLVITAWDEDKLVGYSRSLTDFVFCCYLSDLAVDKEYQKNGIGTEMIRLTEEELNGSMLLLLSAPEAMEYYPKVGFEKAENAFIIKRKS